MAGSDSDSDATRGSYILAGVEPVTGADAAAPSQNGPASPASPPLKVCSPLPPGACWPPSSPIPTHSAESTLSCIIVVNMCADVVL